MSEHKTLEHGELHILSLIHRDADASGWAKVSDLLHSTLSESIPPELAEFEETEEGYRAKLTDEGNSVLSAMKWL